MKKTHETHAHSLSITDQQVEQMKQSFKPVECIEIKAILYMGENQDERLNHNIVSVYDEFKDLPDDDKYNLLYLLIEDARELLLKHTNRDIEWI